ncbi:MAG: hypothetical protein JNM21_07155 [Taibaiella sp.]|nr:hypothetical protein [Taibaiella sp.]
MSYLNIVMPLKDFITYIKKAVTKHAAHIYLEQKSGAKDDAITTVKLDLNKLDQQVPANREQYLNFFIATKVLGKQDSFYDEENDSYAIEGSGGRQDQESVERIALRIISKTPDKSIQTLFKKIRNQLKKDPEIGIGIAGDSALHKNYFYQKNLAGKLVFKTDFHNDKAPLITII